MRVKADQRAGHPVILAYRRAPLAEPPGGRGCEDRPVRIAHLTDCYLPRLGGIEAQVHGLARRQQEAGHEVAVLTATPGAHGERHGTVDLVDGVPVHRLAIRLPFELPVNPFAPRDVRAILLAGRYDAAHVHAGVVSPFAYDAMKVVVDLGLPLVVTWHCMLGWTEHPGHWWERLRDWSAQPVAFTAVSDLAAAPLRRVLGDQVPVTVLPNGVDAAAWRADPLPRAEPSVRLVSAMRLARRKRPVPLLRMASEVRARVPESTPLHLTVLGAGPAEPAMRRLVRRRGMTGWVELAGRVDRARLLETYRGADVYVAPARLESFGIAALEARAAGLPVVARADSGVREFVRDGVEGLLADDDEAMVAAIVRLVREPVLRQRIAAHNRAVAPDQDWAQVVIRADAEYRRAAAIVGGRVA
jgi:glycosyltransferase involved in cell wall biosynthesis